MRDGLTEKARHLCLEVLTYGILSCILGIVPWLIVNAFSLSLRGDTILTYPQGMMIAFLFLCVSAVTDKNR